MSDNERLHWKASFARGACVCERKFRFKPIIQYDVCVCVYAFDAGVHFLCSKTTNGAAIFLVSFQVCTQILQMLHFRVSSPPTNDVFVAVIFQYPKWSRKHYTQTNTSRYIIDEFILQDQNQQNITPTTISADCVWCVRRCSERKVVMRRPLSPPKIKTNNNGASLFNIIIIVFGVVDLLLQAHNINTYSTARHTYVRCVCVWHDAFLKWKFIHSTKYTKKIIAHTISLCNCNHPFHHYRRCCVETKIHAISFDTNNNNVFSHHMDVWFTRKNHQLFTVWRLHTNS